MKGAIYIRISTDYFGKITRKDAIYSVLLNNNGIIVDKYWG